MDDLAPDAIRMSVAVRELCAFTAKRGDLDLRFTPSPTAQEGIEGHAAVARRRGDGYQREVPLEGAYRSLWIRGRADGLHTDPLALEEIKTYRGDVERIPDNHRALHWAQLRCYGAQLCIDRKLEVLELRLVYFHVDTGHETTLTEQATAEDLVVFRDTHAALFLDWAEQQRVHRQVRDGVLAAMAFPHDGFHSGQRLLAEGVYRAIAQGYCLLAQAPTGIGKSIGTLFPALKAMARGKVDKLFFLTAKTSGRQAALQAVQSLTHDGEPIPLRTLELVARSKACVHPDKACHGDSCPLARGFYDRLPAARSAALARQNLDHGAVLETAAVHSVCPYYLAQELVRWADVVIGDVNYYFDASALLHALTVVNDWQVAVLVDEAHNLVDRARAMYSAELQEASIPKLPTKIHAASCRALRKLARDWQDQTTAMTGDFLPCGAPPQRLLDRLQEVTSALGKYFGETPTAANGDLQRFYFDALYFLERAKTYDQHSLCDLQRQSPGPWDKRGKATSALTIRNVVPAPFLAPRLHLARSTVLFSATLSPPIYYRQLLGLSESTRELDVPSPFAADQLTVTIPPGISTRYADRDRSITPIVRCMAEQFRNRPGNYLAFFSSYAYLQQVATALLDQHPDLPVDCQTAGMREADQAAFLAGFVDNGQRLALAVLGGVFAEGVDLPGSRLIGAFVATLGLPQVNPVNERMRDRLTEIFGQDHGYDYAYLVPGLQKVVQAAGRVIRTTGDRGVVTLMDDRYGQRRVRELLPGWWRVGG